MGRKWYLLPGNSIEVNLEWDLKKSERKKTLPRQYSNCWAARLSLPLPLWRDSHQASNLQQLGQSEIKLKLRFTNYTIALEMTLSKTVAPQWSFALDPVGFL